MDIMAKKLVLIVLSCAVWGAVLSGYGVEFKCENQSMADSISKGFSKEPVTMHLLRCLWFFSVYFNTKVTDSHIPAIINIAVDQLSRNKSEEFLQTHLDTSSVPVTIPTLFLKLVSPRMQDWTSHYFLDHFNQTISNLQMYSY